MTMIEAILPLTQPRLGPCWSGSFFKPWKRPSIRSWKSTPAPTVLDLVRQPMPLSRQGPRLLGSFYNRPLLYLLGDLAL